MEVLDEMIILKLISVKYGLRERNGCRCLMVLSNAGYPSGLSMNLLVPRSTHSFMTSSTTISLSRAFLFGVKYSGSKPRTFRTAVFNLWVARISFMDRKIRVNMRMWHLLCAQKVSPVSKFVPVSIYWYKYEQDECPHTFLRMGFNLNSSALWDITQRKPTSLRDLTFWFETRHFNCWRITMYRRRTLYYNTSGCHA